MERRDLALSRPAGSGRGTQSQDKRRQALETSPEHYTDNLRPRICTWRHMPCEAVASISRTHKGSIYLPIIEVQSVGRVEDSGRGSHVYR